MTAITLDVGNSSVGIARWDGAEPRLLRLARPEEAAALVDGPAAAISVNPSRLAALLAALGPRRTDIVVLTGAPLPLVAPSLARGTGSDRLAAALALAPGPAIAVDAGTAVTVDVVDARGVYHGGFIAPGPAAAAAGLASATAALPRLDGHAVPIAVGHDTASALGAGLWGMATGGVDRLVEAAVDYLVALDPAAGPVRVVACGAWGEAWARASRRTGLEVDPLLVHRGVRAWSERA